MDTEFNPYENQNTPKINVEFKRRRGSTKKNGIGAVNAGGAVIIIIFVVLCLTIFGLLSFATSHADKRLADKNLDSVVQYYAADSKAEEKLAKIYDALGNIIISGGNLSDFDFSGFSEFTGFLVEYDEDTISENFLSVSFNTEANISKQADSYLKSVVEFVYAGGTLTYRITDWRIVNEENFDYEDKPLNLYTVSDSEGNPFGFD